MDRRFRRIIVAALLVCSATGARAQDASISPPPPPEAPAPPRPGGPDDSLRVPPDRPGKLRRGSGDEPRRFEKLPPEQREKFRENLRRWQEMPPEERQELRTEEQRRHERIAHEIDETLKKAGLQLNADQRQVFALRYMQERRKIEETLRKEMEAKRRPMLDEVMERLKREMVTAASASASPSATPSATPK